MFAERPKFVPELEPDFVIYNRPKERLFIIIRHPNSAHLCGYVILVGEESFKLSEEQVGNLEVHGGVTWNDSDFPQQIPFNLEKPFYCIGFDCAHIGDKVEHFWKLPDEIKKQMPSENLFGIGETYKDLEYCYNELVGLEEQIDLIFQNETE